MWIKTSVTKQAGQNLTRKSGNGTLKEGKSESLTTSVQPNGYLVSNQAIYFIQSTVNHFGEFKGY